ncbi:MAG TPA: alcohol dehydrogenase catalytic domain-containing protein [Clostridiaceae bacterium]|nr:alcohol dehydrogenase catalytic domain-containing protein [Clostridiaceae bacterium]
MKELVLTGANHVDLLDKNQPKLTDGEALVKIAYGGICGSDVHIMCGQHPTAKPPFIMGHEACGVIDSIAAGTETDLQIGDIVALHPVRQCYVCDACHNGLENLCDEIKICGAGIDGFYMQYKAVPIQRLVKFTQCKDLKLCALAEPLTVAVHCFRATSMKPGDSVFIAGAGTIGIILAIMARFYGSRKVVLVEVNSDRIEIAKKFGFDVLDGADPNVVETAIASNNGEFFEHTFEVSGHQSGFDNCLKLTKKNGYMIQVGMPPHGFEIDIDQLIYKELTMKGVRHHRIDDMVMAVKIIDSGLLNDQLINIISDVYKKEDSQEAFKTAINDKTKLKVLIDFS